jgi:hypothetical protein
MEAKERRKKSVKLTHKRPNKFSLISFERPHLPGALRGRPPRVLAHPSVRHCVIEMCCNLTDCRAGKWPPATGVRARVTGCPIRSLRLTVEMRFKRLVLGQSLVFIMPAMKPGAIDSRYRNVSALTIFFSGRCSAANRLACKIIL